MSYGTRSTGDQVLFYVYDCDCCGKRLEVDPPYNGTPIGWERQMVFYGPIGVFVVHCPECVGIAAPAEPPVPLGPIARAVMDKVKNEKQN